MSLLLDTWTTVVAAALARCAVSVRQMAPRHWTFTPRDARDLSVDARLTTDWLLFDAPLGPAQARADLDFEVFAVNSALPPGLRLCTADSDPRLRLRAEVPLLEDMPIAHRVERLCTGMAVATKWLATLTVEAEQIDLFGAPADCDLERLCRETGWPFTPRQGGAVMVELAVPGVFRQAALNRRHDGVVALAVSLLADAPASPMCAAAVVRFMLALTGAVRMVSAVHQESEGGEGGAGFGIRFEQAPASEELAHAFAAISIAWRCGGREVALLAQDERIARLYLAACGEQPGDDAQNTQTT